MFLVIFPIFSDTSLYYSSYKQNIELISDFAGTKLAFINQDSGLSIFDIITRTTTQIMDNTPFVRFYNQMISIAILYCSEIIEDNKVLSLSKPVPPPAQL